MLTFNGKKVPNNHLSDVYKQHVIHQTNSQLNAKLVDLVCIKHSKTPIANFDFNSSKVNISGCCEAVILDAKKLLEG